MGKTHMSTKVPNYRSHAQPLPQKAGSSSTSKGGKVKAGKAGGARKGNDELLLVEDNPQEETTEALNVVQRPLRGVIISCTGVRDKQTLSNLATDLGAVMQSSLTDTTTHLIACEFSSEKYKVSLSLGLPILTPDWIYQSHAVWKEAGEVNLKESVASHRLPAFQGLRICISGFPEGIQRDTMIALIESLKGEYSKVLDPSCTHLISTEATTPKTEFAKGVNAALLLHSVQGLPPLKRTVFKNVDDGRGGKKRVEYERDQVEIKVVRPEWFWDCVGAHGRWKEDEYDVSRPLESITPKNVTQFIPPKDLALRGKDSALFDLADALVAESTSAAAVLAVPRTNAVPLGDERLEQAVLKPRRVAGRVVGAGVASLVQDILGSQRPAEASTSKSRRPLKDIKDEEDLPMIGDNDNAHRDRQASSEQAKLLNPVAPAQLGRMLSKARSTSFASTSNAIPSALGMGPSLVLGDSVSNRSSSNGSIPTTSPFKGLRFLLKCGTKQVRGDMEKCIPVLKGVIVKEEEKDIGEGFDFVVVKLSRGAPRFALPSPTSPTRPQVRFVTQHWIESCYRDDQLCPLESFRHHTPITVSMPIPGAGSIVISATKLPFRMQVCLANLIDCLGGVYEATFSRKVTHLICSAEEVEGQKYDLALKWGIPVVSPEWLTRMADEGRVPELQEFLLGRSVRTDKVDRTAVDRASVPEPARTDSRTSTNRTFSRAPSNSASDAAVARASALGSTPTLVDKDLLVLREELSPGPVSPPTVAFNLPSSRRPLTNTSSLSRNYPPPSPLPQRLKATGSLESPLSPPQRVSTSRLLNEASTSTFTFNPLPIAIITTVASSPSASTSELPLQAPTPPKPSARALARVLSEGSSSFCSTGGSPVFNTDSGGTLSAVAKGKKRAAKGPALTDDLKDMIDRMGEEKREPLLPSRESDERASKRKRVLGRPGRTTRSPSAAHSIASVLSPGVSPSKSTSSARYLSPPPPPVFPSTYQPNSPPSSYMHHQPDGEEEESFRVVYDDPEARREKQRIMEAINRGEKARRGEVWEEEESQESVLAGAMTEIVTQEEEEESQIVAGGRRKSARMRR